MKSFQEDCYLETSNPLRLVRAPWVARAQRLVSSAPHSSRTLEDDVVNFNDLFAADAEP